MTKHRKSPRKETKYHICKICSQSLFELKQTQQVHLETRHNKVVQESNAYQYFRAPFVHELLSL